MATIGVDCDIILAHASVNGGAGYGFVLRRPRSGDLGPTVKLQRQAYTTVAGGYSDRLRFWMSVLLDDNLLNPDGSRHTETRSGMYAMLVAFLGARTGIILSTRVGVWTDLHATLTVTHEDLGVSRDIVTLLLNNGAYTQTAPIDLTRFSNSLWDGPLTWDTSYWR